MTASSPTIPGMGALGVRSVLNAGAPQSRLGGSTLAPAVFDAMRTAAASYVDVDELHDAVAAELARLTGNEAACVVAGSAAGIMVAVAALIAGTDRRRAETLPRTDAPRPTVAVWNRHLRGMLAGTESHDENGYVNSIYQGGARLREIDDITAVRATDSGLLLFPNVYLHDTEASLRAAVAAAHQQGVPVIVDAADQVPPSSNLSNFTARYGADLAIFSGGKGIGGPSSTALMVGRPDLIAACRTNSSVEHCVGRVAKVGREELVGLLAAMRLMLDIDEDAQYRAWQAVVRQWHSQFADLSMLRTSMVPDGHCWQRVPRLILTLTSESTTCRDHIVDELWDATPRIAVLPAPPAALALSPQLLSRAEAAAIVEPIRHELRRHADCLTDDCRAAD